MVHGQYEKDKLEPLPPGTELDRTSKAYVPQQDRRHAQLVASSVQEGMVPHNAQLAEILNRIESTLQRQMGAGELSTEGQKVAKDLQNVVGVTREALEEKNKDELLQKIVYTSGRATQALATDPTAQQRARIGAAQAPTRQKLMEGINNLARQFSMSNEFRNVLRDLNHLIRELFFSEEDIQQQQWGQQSQSQQQWGQSGGVGQLGQQIGQVQIGGQQYPVGLGSQQQSQFQQPSSFGAGSSSSASYGSGGGSDLFGNVGGVIGRETGQSSQFGQPSQFGQQPPSSQLQLPQAPEQQGLYGPSYGQFANRGDPLSSTFQQQPSSFQQGTQQQQQQQQPPQGGRPGDNWQPPQSLDVEPSSGGSKTSTYKAKPVSEEGSRVTNKTRQLLKTDMSQQKKERIVQDWTSIVRRINADAGMREAFDTLMNLGYEIKDSSAQAASVAGQLPPSKAEIEAESFLIATRYHLRRLIENMAGGRSLDFLRMAVLDFQYKTANDDVFNRYMRALRSFLQKSISDSAYVNSSEYPQTSMMMLDGAQQISRRHEDATERLLYEVDELDEAIRNDEITQRLSTASTQLTHDLFQNEQGRWTFKPELINDLRQILVPIIVEQLRYIAVPKITGSDEDMDFEVDNIIFRAKDVIPSNVHLENRAMLDVNTMSTKVPSLWDSALLIRITDIVAELRDVKFAYRRKKFPKLHDRGELDVILGGKGIGIDAEMVASRTDPNHIFRVGDVNCTCSKIDIENMAGEEHKMMYTLLKPIIESRVRRNIVMSVEDTVRKVLTMADERLFAMRRSSGTSGTSGGSSGYKGSSSVGEGFGGAGASKTGETYVVPAVPGRSVGNTGVLESGPGSGAYGSRMTEDTGVGGPTTTSGGGPTAYAPASRY